MYGSCNFYSHFLIFFLKIFKLMLFLISVGNMFHTSQLDNLREFRPYGLELPEVLRNSVFNLGPYIRLSLIWKILLTMGAEMFFLALSNSMAKDCTFLL